MSMECDCQQAMVMDRKSSTPVDTSDCRPTAMTRRSNQISDSDTLSTQNRKYRPNPSATDQPRTLLYPRTGCRKRRHNRVSQGPTTVWSRCHRRQETRNSIPRSMRQPPCPTPMHIRLPLFALVIWLKMCWIKDTKTETEDHTHK